VPFQENQIKARPSNLLDRVVDKLSTTTGGATAVPFAPLATTSATSAAAAWLHRYGGNAFTGVTGHKDSISTRTGTPTESGAASPSISKGPGAQLGATGTVDALSQDDGMIRLDVVEKFLRIHAEAIGRVVELSVGGEM
jgi:hypothetical protein